MNLAERISRLERILLAVATACNAATPSLELYLAIV
jgi:hypothetical protein